MNSLDPNLGDSVVRVLHTTTDAQQWARQFNLVYASHHDGEQLDEGWLIGWFANAIEVGRAAGREEMRNRQHEIDEWPRT